MSTLSCGFCTHRNPTDARFCSDCGSPLTLKPCPKCEAITDVGAERCHQCGAAFDVEPILEPPGEPASPGRSLADAAEPPAARDETPEDVHIPESLADRLDDSGRPRSNAAPIAPEVASSIAGYPDRPEPDDARALRGNRAAPTRRGDFRFMAIAAAVIVIGVAAYVIVDERIPTLRGSDDVARVGDGSAKAVPTDSLREAPASVGSAGKTPAEPAAPAVRVGPADAAQSEPQPAKSQPEPVGAAPQTAKSQPEPVKSRTEPAVRASKVPDASAIATQRLIARDLGGFAATPRTPSPPLDRDAIETQRLIERDLGPFLRRDASGATGGASPAIN